MTVRLSFVDRFGEAEASRIEEAAAMHYGWHMMREEISAGSDPFRTCIAICIGFECLSTYREDHGIEASEEDLRSWVIEHGDLKNHDGDFDGLALLIGEYQNWMPS